MIKKLLLIISIYLTATGVATAAGLSVSPTRLDFEVIDESRASQIITVMNPTADVMIFEVYPDEFENIISANPESFTLESGGRKEVLIAIDAKNINKSQSISTNLSVVGKPLAESKVSVGAGAKIPVTVNLAPAKDPPANKTLLIVILAAAVLSAAFYLGRRTKHSPDIKP